MTSMTQGTHPMICSPCTCVATSKRITRADIFLADITDTKEQAPEEPIDKSPESIEPPQKKKKAVKDPIYTHGKERRKNLNKLYARKSRIKKKEYIHMLEEENQILKNKIEEYKTIIEQNNCKSKLSYIARTSNMQEMLSGKSELYKILEYRINSGDSEAIEDMVKQISTRYSLQASEKAKCFETITSNFLEILIPPCYKYMLWSSKMKMGIFGQSKDGKLLLETSKEIFGELKLSDNICSIIKQLSPSIDEIRVKMSQLLIKFVNSQNELFSECLLFEKFVANSFLSIIPPLAAAQYLHSIDNLKYLEDLKEEPLFDLPLNLLKKSKC